MAAAGEGDRVAAAPVMLLEPQQMLGDHIAIHAPAIGEANECAQPDLIDPRLAKAIRRIQTPEEVLLLPFR